MGESDERAAYRAALVEFLETHKADLDEDSQRRLRTQPAAYSGLVKMLKHKASWKMLQNCMILWVKHDAESLCPITAVSD